jgi:glycosyltransferase involved in cell wall biosynthesis
LYEDIGRSQHFCTPNKLWEYAAAGVPALASDLPEIARIVGGRKTGFLLPAAAAPAEIAGVVNGLDATMLSQASANAIRFSQDETWDSEVNELIAVVAKLARDKTRDR